MSVKITRGMDDDGCLVVTLDVTKEEGLVTYDVETGILSIKRHEPKADTPKAPISKSLIDGPNEETIELPETRESLRRPAFQGTTWP